MIRVARLSILVIVSSLIAFEGQVRSDEPIKSKINPRALAMLGEIAAAYRALPAYRDAGSVTLKRIVEGQSETRTTPVTIALVRPNALSVVTPLARLVCDGKIQLTIATPLKRYTEAPAPGVLSFETVFTGGALGSALFGSPAAPMLSVVTNFLLGNDATRAVLDLGDTLALESDAPLDGVSCHLLKVGSESGASYRLWIDPKTKLLRAIDMDLASSAKADPAVAIHRFAWTSGPISTERAPASTFRVTPPADFEKVGTVAGAKGDRTRPGK